MPFLDRKIQVVYPECQEHSGKRCEVNCKDCNKPVCVKCIVSGTHKGHDVEEFTETVMVNQMMSNAVKAAEQAASNAYRTCKEIFYTWQTRTQQNATPQEKKDFNHVKSAWKPKAEKWKPTEEKLEPEGTESDQ